MKNDAQVSVLGPDVDGIIHITIDGVKTFMLRYNRDSMNQRLDIFKMAACREITVVACVKQKGK